MGNLSTDRDGKAEQKERLSTMMGKEKDGKESKNGEC